jgi:hypothetical protein
MGFPVGGPCLDRRDPARGTGAMAFDPETLTFDARGLVPAVAQDAETARC